MRVSQKALDAWIAEGWPSGPPPWKREAFVEMYEHEQRQLAKQKAKSLEAQEIDRLGRRVSALERAIGPGGGMVKAVAEAIGLVRSDLERKITYLGERQLKFCGVHETGRRYEPGALVVRAGGLWHCHTATTAQPGRSDCWQLAVKAGESSRGVVA